MMILDEWGPGVLGGGDGRGGSGGVNLIANSKDHE